MRRTGAQGTGLRASAVGDSDCVPRLVTRRRRYSSARPVYVPRRRFDPHPGGLAGWRGASRRTVGCLDGDVYGHRGPRGLARVAISIGAMAEDTSLKSLLTAREPPREY